MRSWGEERLRRGEVLAVLKKDIRGITLDQTSLKQIAVEQNNNEPKLDISKKRRPPKAVKRMPK